MRAHHVAASRDVADQQDHENAVENDGSRRCLRAEIEKAVDEINGVTANQYSPAARVGSVTIDDGDKAKRKHPRECPKTWRSQSKRDNPDRDVGDNLMEQSNWITFSEVLRVGFGHLFLYRRRRAHGRIIIETFRHPLR